MSYSILTSSDRSHINEYFLHPTVFEDAFSPSQVFIIGKQGQPKGFLDFMLPTANPIGQSLVTVSEINRPRNPAWIDIAAFQFLAVPETKLCPAFGIHLPTGHRSRVAVALN